MTREAAIEAKRSVRPGVRISVALCTFNGARFLQAQLESMASQVQPPDELVVCDDGSADATVGIVEIFAGRAPFPVNLHVNDRRLGVTANFSRAISLCRHEVIALSDQDDVWYPDKLRRLAAEFSTDATLGLAFTDADVVADDGSPLRYRLWDAVRFSSAERRFAAQGRLFDVLLRHYVVTGATLAFRAAHNDLVLPIPEHCLHDAWIALLITAVAPGIAIESPMIAYRQHVNQASGGERVLTLQQKLAIARRQDATYMDLTADRFGAARDRLRTRHPGSVRAVSRLGAKTAHFRNRARIKRDAAMRPFIVAQGLLTGRYHRYCESWTHALADLML